MLQLQHLIEQRYSVLQEFERRTTQALKHLNSKDIKSKQLNWWHFDEIINAIMSSEHERQLKEEQLLHEMHSDIIPITTNDDQFIQSSLSIMRSIDNSFVYSETPLNNNNNNLKPNTSAKIIGDLYKLFFAKQLEAKKYNSTRTMQQAGLLDQTTIRVTLIKWLTDISHCRFQQRITIAKVDIQDRSYVQIEEDKTITTADTSVSIAGGNGYDNRGNSEHEQRHNKQNDTIYPKNGNNQTQVIILSQPSLRSPSPFTQPFSTTSSVSSRSQSSSRVADILLLNSTSKSNCSSQPNGMITPSLHNNLQSNGFPRLSQPSRRLFDRTIRLMQIQKEQHRSRRAISEDNKDGSTGKNNSNNNNKQYQTTFLSESKRYGQNRLMSNGNDKSIQQVDKQIGQQQQQQQRMWMSQYSPQRRASCDNNQKGFKNNNNNNITNSSNTNISINNNNSNNTINLKAILSVYHKNYQKSMSQDENNNNNNNNNKYLNRTMTQTTATTPSNYSFHNSDCRIQLELKSLLDLDTIRNPLSSLLRRNYSSEQIQAAKTTLFNNLLMLNAHVKATQDWYYKAFNSKTKIKKNKSVTSSHSCGGIKESININIKDIDNLDNKQIEQDNQAKHDQDCYDDQEQKYNQELQLKVNQLSQQEQQEHYSVSTNNRNPIQDKIYSNNAYSWLQQQQQEPKLRRISALFDDQMRKINDSPQKFRLSLLNMKDKSKRLKGIQQECINNEQDIMISELFDSDEQQNEEQNNQEQLLTISAIPLKQLIDNDKDQMQFNARMAGRRVLSVDSCGTMIRNNYQKQSCQDNNNNNNNNSEKKSVPQQNPIILLNAPNLLHTAAVTTTTTTNNKVNNKISMNATFASNASKNQSVVNKISSTVAWNNNNNNNNSNNNNSSYNNNNKIKISALKNNNNNTNINNSNNSTTTFAHYRLSPISVTQAYYSLSPQIHDQIQSTNTASINQQNSQYPCFQSPSDQIDITKVSSLQSPLAPTTTAAPNIISQCSLAASTSNNSSRLNYISESTFRNTSTFLPRTILSNDLHSNNKKNYNNILNNASNNNSNSNSARKKRFSLQGKNNNNTNNSSMDMELIGSITKTNQSKGLSQNQDTMYLRNISSLKQQEKIEESSQNGQKINDLLVNDERNIIKDITTFNSSDNNTNKSITKHLIDEIFFNRSHSKYKNDRKNHMSKTNRSNSITNNSCNPNIGMTTPIETMINTYTGKKNKYNIDNNSSSNNNNNGQWRVNLLQQQQNKIDQTDEDNKQGSNNNNNYPQLFSNQLIKASIKLSDLDSLSYRRQIQSKWRNYSYFNHAEQQQQQQKQQQQQPSLDPIQYLNQKISKFLPNNQ